MQTFLAAPPSPALEVAIDDDDDDEDASMQVNFSSVSEVSDMRIVPVGSSCKILRSFCPSKLSVKISLLGNFLQGF